MFLLDRIKTVDAASQCESLELVKQSEEDEPTLNDENNEDGRQKGSPLKDKGKRKKHKKKSSKATKMTTSRKNIIEDLRGK